MNRLIVCNLYSLLACHFMIYIYDFRHTYIPYPFVSSLCPTVMFHMLQNSYLEGNYVEQSSWCMLLLHVLYALAVIQYIHTHARSLQATHA